jgi:hypothetical protein
MKIKTIEIKPVYISLRENPDLEKRDANFYDWANQLV